MSRESLPASTTLTLNAHANRSMSNLTRHLLATTDIAAAARRRTENFAVLEELMTAAGLERFGEQPSCGPFAWPLRSPVPDLHASLHERGVFAPVLWPDVVDRAGSTSDEAWVVRHCVPLPVDHHLGTSDMVEVAHRTLAALDAAGWRR